MAYSLKLAEFHGTFQVPLSSQSGPWVASVDVNSFDDGYGNRGPVSSVLKPFSVSPATFTVSAITADNNYNIGDIVVISASVVTPAGDNFTGGTVPVTKYHTARQNGGPLQMFYDQKCGSWGCGFHVNSSDPAG